MRCGPRSDASDSATVTHIQGVDRVDRSEGRAGLTLTLCFAAVVCEGIDIQSMGLAAPRMAPALGLAREQLGPVFSASLVGLLIGAVVFGRLADRVGRKWTLIGSLALFGGFSLATAFVGNVESLLVVRVLAGLGLGGALPNLIALSAEALPIAGRARVVTRLTCGMPLGGAVAGLVAANLGWKDIFFVGAMAPLALVPVMAMAMPESRAFLATRARPMPAKPAITEYPHILFGGGRAVPTLLLWVASFGSLLALYVMLNWLPTLLGDKGLTKSGASNVALLFNLGAVCGVLILAGLLEGRRKRLALCVWNVGLGAAVVALAYVGKDFLAAGAAGFATGFTVSSVPLPLYGLAPGHYEVSMRGTGVGASVAIGRMGAIVGPLLAASLLGLGAGATGVLLAILPISAIAGGATLGLLGRPTLD